MQGGENGASVDDVAFVALAVFNVVGREQVEGLRTASKAYCVRECLQDGVEAFRNGLGTSREIDDKRGVTDAGRLSGQNGGWRFGERDGAHEFAKAGQEFLTDVHRGLRCDITWRGPSSPRGQDETAGGRPLLDDCLDFGLLVGDYLALRFVVLEVRL